MISVIFELEEGFHIPLWNRESSESEQFLGRFVKRGGVSF